MRRVSRPSTVLPVSWASLIKSHTRMKSGLLLGEHDLALFVFDVF